MAVPVKAQIKMVIFEHFLRANASSSDLQDYKTKTAMLYLCT